jgi:hypothetical protein
LDKVFVLPAAHWQACALTINLFLETDLLGSLSVLGSATPFIFPFFPLSFSDPARSLPAICTVVSVLRTLLCTWSAEEMPCNASGVTAHT